MPPTRKVYSYLRFSTPQQLKGDSLRRQIERSQQWCQEHGLELDESLTMKDLGLSAYHGLHKTKGMLGQFLNAIKAGQVPEGSILLVESLDRLSREDVLDAQTQFLSIINAGIEIVTLIDGYRYSRESIKENWAQLIISLSVMSRANEESKTKADRLGKVWQKKRQNTHVRKLTSVSPNWLKLNKETQSFELINERVEIIQRIFKEYLDGHGAYTITKRLNDENVPTFGRSDKWGLSTVKKILHNRSVLGEFQPHRLVTEGAKKTRIPEGDPISDYYPRIIGDGIFYSVQTRLNEKTGKGGRVGFVRNLFQRVAVCGYCGATMQFANKGRWQYIQCGNKSAGRGCDATPWPYSDFEDAFLSQCTELDVSAILSDGNERTQNIQAAHQDIDVVKNELEAIEKRIGNYDKAIEIADSKASIEHFVEKVTTAKDQKKDAEKRLSVAIMAFHAAQLEAANTGQQLESLKALNQKLRQAIGNEMIELRTKLRGIISQIVDHIEIFPDGLCDRILSGDAITGRRWESIDDLMAHYENLEDDPDIFQPGDYNAIIGELSAYKARNTGKQDRAFVVWFKAGGWRLVKRDGDVYTNHVSTMESILHITTTKQAG